MMLVSQHDDDDYKHSVGFKAIDTTVITFKLDFNNIILHSIIAMITSLILSLFYIYMLRFILRIFQVDENK